MSETNIENIQNIIEIRRDPYIYAFSTNEIPAHIKVGDTFRPIEQRLDEWRKVYSNLLRLFPDKNNESEGLAKVNDEIYFRDYSLHEFFERKDGECRLKSDNGLFDKNPLLYYSNEFFRDIDVDTIKDGIEDIKNDFSNGSTKYKFYSLLNKEVYEKHWDNSQDWTLRDNQEEVVENFKSKVFDEETNKDGEKELLMYAVMRFGKSFTALSCAKAKEYKKILVVSAKADVVGEWKKTVEMPKCFKEYRFLKDSDFVNDPDVIAKTLKHDVEEAFKNKSGVVVFLTLQNLSQKDSNGKDIKNKLKKLFETEFDLVIIDETHYGAWAKCYGAPLNNKEEDEDFIKKDLKEYDKFIKTTNDKINAKVKLHLSGTPYNLLYDEKFTQKNIIATCQFSDILDAKEKWCEEHLDDINKGVENPTTGQQFEEFDNPYFGFPKMLRFAFNVPETTREKLIKLKKDGKWSLNDLFETDKNDGNTRFIHEADVLKLLKAIDSSDSHQAGILEFLDIPKIKDNNVCKHIVMVLPYKYSCDAMENLLNSHKDEFKNLVNDNVEVLNITGHKVKPGLVDVDSVKAKISECEKQNKKTITLTVNKMLTGVTVPEWETMIMLKNSKSPQEYDQAIFRIQNQYVKEYVDPKSLQEAEDANDATKLRIIKKDMKPQTILVDFDPMRMFELQGLSTRIVKSIKNDDKTLEEAVKKEIECFPIIAYNADKLVQVDPNNLIEIILNYNNKKSLMDGVANIKLNRSILSDEYIKKFIVAQSKIDISNKLTAEAHKGGTKDIDLPSSDGGNAPSDEKSTTNTEDSNNDSSNDLEKKFRMCILGLSFYAFLTNSSVSDLPDVLRSLDCDDKEERDRNKRIFGNLNLDKQFIKHLVEKSTRLDIAPINDFIKKANLLSKDQNLSPEERAKNALNNFSRISESEIVTPLETSEEMVNALNGEENNLINIVQGGGRILDIASKTGEFTYALYTLMKGKVDDEKLKNALYAIPTSTVTYEFTRKMYENLKLPIENIAVAENFNSYDLIKRDENDQIDYEKIAKALSQNKPFNEIKLTDEPQEGEKDMIRFDAVVGNPPYQELRETTKDMPIYHYFMNVAYKVSKKAALITPAKFLFNSGATPKDWNRERLNDIHFTVVKSFEDSSKAFPNNTPIPGGVAISYRDVDKDFGAIEIFSQYPEMNQIRRNILSNNDFIGLDTIMFPYSAYTLSEQFWADFPEKKERAQYIIAHRKELSAKDKQGQFSNLRIITTNIFDLIPEIFFDNKPNDGNEYCCLIGRQNNQRLSKYVLKKYIDVADNYNYFKVIISIADGAAGRIGHPIPCRLCGMPIVVGKETGYTQTFQSIGCVSDENEAKNIAKFIKSKFARAALGLLKVTQHYPVDKWKYVPIQDFTQHTEEEIKASNGQLIDWSKSISEIDKQLYAKYNLNESEIAFIESMIKPME